MQQNKKNGSELPPFTPMLVWAVINATPDEQAVILAIQLLHWWRGDEAKGIELIKAVLIDPDRKKMDSQDRAFQSPISEKGIKRALASLRKRGWVVTERITQANGYREAQSFKLNIPVKTFNQAYEAILGRLPELLRAKMAPFNTIAGQGSLFEKPKDPPAPVPKIGFKYLPSWEDALNGPYREKYGRSLTDTANNAKLMIQAKQIFYDEENDRDDLVPSWKRYLAADGYKGSLKEARHPLAWFIKTPDTWRTSVDPAVARTAAEEVRRRTEDAVRNNAIKIERDRREKMLAIYLAMGPSRQQLLLKRVGAVSQFQSDWIRKYDKNPIEMVDDMRLTMIEEIWTEYPQPPAAGPSL